MLKPETTKRRSMISKIHIAKNQLALDDSSYQDLLHRVAGKTSSKDMTLPQLDNVLKEFKRLGFEKKPSKRAGTRPRADAPMARKIRALWLSLYHLGAINDPSETSLAKFVSRHTRVKALQWLTPTQANNVINALKAWLERCGHAFPTPADVIDLSRIRSEHIRFSTETPSCGAIAEKIALIKTQLSILRMKESDLMEKINDRGLGFYEGLNLIYTEQYDAVVEMLGNEVRSAIGRK